jgi:hypothetical protein
MRPSWVRDGGILLGLGASFAALGAAALAVFDTCLGSATCFGATAGMNVEGFLGLLVMGILMAVGGGTAVAVGLRLPSKALSALDIPVDQSQPR